MFSELSIPRMVTRGMWGARPFKESIELMQLPVENVVVHHRIWPVQCRDQTECSTMVRELQSFHQDYDLADLHWNFLIAPDGAMYEGRGWLREPSKSGRHREYDNNKYEVGFFGDFGKIPVPEEMQKALEKWIEMAILKGYLKSNFNLVEDKEPLPLRRNKAFTNGFRTTLDFSWISRHKKNKKTMRMIRLKEKHRWDWTKKLPDYPNYKF